MDRGLGPGSVNALRVASAGLAAVLLLAGTLTAAPQARAGVRECPLDGDGTVGTPFLVADALDLAAVAREEEGCGAGARYRQTADIVLSAPVAPALSNFTPIPEFTGVYDGGGRSIRGLTIEATAGNQGLVDRIGSAGVVQDLLFIDATVTGTFNVGSLAGESYGTIRSVRATGTIDGSSDNVGGLVGLVGAGTVEASGFDGTVTSTAAGGDGRVGGLVGLLDGGTITSSYASGTVVASDARYVGGLVGWAFAGLSDSYSTADVTGSRAVGGLVGEFDHYSGPSSLTRTHASGLVVGTTEVGGLVGSLANGTVEASFWDTEASRIGTSAGGTGLPTAAMTDLVTFEDDGWSIALGWVPAGADPAGDDVAPAASRPVWGICPEANGGYPFLQSQYDEDPCAGPGDDRRDRDRRGGDAPVPTSVPSGGGPAPAWSIVLLAIAGGLVLRRVPTVGARG